MQKEKWTKAGARVIVQWVGCLPWTWPTWVRSLAPYTIPRVFQEWPLWKKEPFRSLSGITVLGLRLDYSRLWPQTKSKIKGVLTCVSLQVISLTLIKGFWNELPYFFFFCRIYDLRFQWKFVIVYDTEPIFYCAYTYNLYVYI